MANDTLGTSTSERYVCERYGMAVMLPEALIGGELTDSEELTCGKYTEPANHSITDGEA